VNGARPKRPAAAEKAPTRRPPAKADIRAFLAENPQYLTDNPDVLAAITPRPRHAGERLTDLQSFLIARLRSENERLLLRHADLLATTRANVLSQGRIHAAALMILEARSFKDLIEIATNDLAMRLDVDVAVLAVESEECLGKHSVSGIRLFAPGEVDRLMGPDRDVVLRTGVTGTKALYGAGAGLVASEALLRLRASPEAPTGILALASRDLARFDPGQGTELLTFLGGVIELCIRTWLGLPRSRR
jgi:hypothetical protein